MPFPSTASPFTARGLTWLPSTRRMMIKKAVGVTKGSATPQSVKVGKITRAQLEEIAKTKMKDLTAADMDAAVRTIAGSARSMGVNVEGV